MVVREKDINFLINDLNHESNNTGEKKQGISVTSIAIMVVLLLSAVATLLIPKIYLDRLESQVQAIETQIADVKYAEINAVKNELISITQKVNNKKMVISAIDYSAVNASQSLMVVEQAMPVSAFLTNFRFNVDRLEVGIKTENALIASEFMGNLDRLSLLSRETESIEYDYSDSEVLYKINYTITEAKEWGSKWN